MRMPELAILDTALGAGISIHSKDFTNRAAH